MLGSTQGLLFSGTGWCSTYPPVFIVLAGEAEVCTGGRERVNVALHVSSHQTKTVGSVQLGPASSFVVLTYLWGHCIPTSSGLSRRAWNWQLVGLNWASTTWRRVSYVEPLLRAAQSSANRKSLIKCVVTLVFAWSILRLNSWPSDR